jgi:hypothetical protein
MAISDEIRVPLKMAQWEIAKGHLRALVALQGSYFGDNPRDNHDSLENTVEAFIKDVEENGYAE